MLEQLHRAVELTTERLTSPTCETCGHHQHVSGRCAARYHVTFEPGEGGDPCLCTHQAFWDPERTDG